MFDAPMSTTSADAFPEANLENPLVRCLRASQIKSLTPTLKGPHFLPDKMPVPPNFPWRSQWSSRAPL